METSCCRPTMSWRVCVWVLVGLALQALSCRLVTGLPVRPPDLKKCKPAQKRDGRTVDCCIPHDMPVKDFQFPDPSEPLRVRKNAAYLDAESIDKYNEAYRRMRALPPTDPRSMTVQQNIHCGYCNEGFNQLGSSKVLWIHANWMVLPFHRWYVYFHERILASLIDDPTFTIPFWNWDNQSSVHTPLPNAIPKYFYTSPALNNAHREPAHAPPAIPNLHWGKFFGKDVPQNATLDEIRVYNQVFMHQSIVSGSALPDLFLGGIYRFDEDFIFSPSLFEVGPHAAIHGWVGNSANPMGEDMAPSYSAARDPLFFVHHSNVDRLFLDWHALGGRRGYPTDPDWLNSSFLFYDEKGEMVRVTVAQCLNIDKLRYSFEFSENSWLKDLSIPLSSPTSSESGIWYRILTAAARLSSSLGFPSKNLANPVVDIPDIESLEDPKFVSAAFHSRVALPQASRRSSGEPEQLEKVLVIDGIWVPSGKPIWFEIFINLPNAAENTHLNATEWCGRFTNGPQLLDDGAEHTNLKAKFSISISEKLKKLGILSQTSLVVSLVPKGRFHHMHEVHIKTIRIELR